MQTISAHGSIILNRRLGGKFPHLTICAEVWILHRTGWILFLDVVMFILFWERNHCQNQYLTYGHNLKGKLHGKVSSCSDDLDWSSFS